MNDRVIEIHMRYSPMKVGVPDGAIAFVRELLSEHYYDLHDGKPLPVHSNIRAKVNATERDHSREGLQQMAAACVLAIARLDKVEYDSLIDAENNPDAVVVSTEQEAV